MSDTLHTFVYGLHEGDHNFWYVGMTKDTDVRLTGHRRSNPRATPDTQLHILEEVAGTLEEVREAERLWIDGLRAVGYPLVNDERNVPYGGSHPVSAQTRLRMSEARTGKTLSAEHRRRIGEGNLGRVPSNKGIPMSEEQKRKISAARKAATAIT